MKKSANCIIVSVFNNTLHNDLPSQIIHLPTKMPHSETSYVTLKKKTFHKDITDKSQLSRKLSHLMSVRHVFSTIQKEA